MSAARTLPFLRAAPDRVVLSRWHMGDAGSGQPLEGHVPGWDSNLRLHLEQHIRLDAGELRSDCGLPCDAPLRLIVRWHCSSTQYKDVSHVAELPQGGTVDARAVVALEGARLGGTLDLTTAVVLAGRLPRAPIRAWMPGTVLWEGTRSLRLEGGGSRFPMTAVDFKTAGHRLPSGAAWHLDFDPDELDLPVLGCVMLYLNSGHSAVRGMLENPTEPASLLVRSVMQHDVACQLVRAALASDAFLGRTDPWPRDSLGVVMARLFKNRFKRDEIAWLRQEMRDHPARFESLLQDRLGILSGVRP